MTINLGYYYFLNLLVTKSLTIRCSTLTSFRVLGLTLMLFKVVMGILTVKEFLHLRYLSLRVETYQVHPLHMEKFI